MKIAIVSNKTKKSERVAAQLTQKIKLQAGLVLEKEYPDLVISVGGDGTLLKAFRQYAHRCELVEFIGVHTGHLGFYADWRDFELAELVASLQNPNRTRVSYPLLEIEVTYQDHKVEKYLALNESTIKSISTTMICDVLISDELFENFRGDGLAFSTPTGSTAYNKSVGGAVIHPSIQAMQLTEIASLNNRVFRTLGSPMVFCKEEWVVVELQWATRYLITIDQQVIERQNIKSVKYKIANQQIHFASTKHTHFWKRVRDSFIAKGD